jgi:hypothetical protein
MAAKFAVRFNKAAPSESNLNSFDKEFLTCSVRRKSQWKATETWRMSVCIWSRIAQRGGGGEKWEPSQNSRQLECDVKQIPSYGSTNIRSKCTKFSRPGALEGWVSAALVVEVSFLLCLKNPRS